MTASTTLSEADLRRLWDVVSPEASQGDGPELPEQVMRGLAELIPCGSISFFVMDTRRGELKANQELLLADLPPEPEGAGDLFFEAYWDCLACCYSERFDDHDLVTMWRDFYSEKEYQRLLMAEYFRSIGVWHELLVTLPPQHGYERRLMLVREAGDGPFSERDRLLLTLLRPHLISIRARVEAERQTVPVLTPRQVELLQRVSRGDTNRQVARDLGLSEGTVRKHLENIYARLEVNSRTEAVARVQGTLVT